MRAFSWILWACFVVATCSVAISAPDVARNMPSAAAPRSIPLTIFMSTVLLAFSLHARFRMIPRLIAASALPDPSLRLVTALAAAWFASLFSLGGTILVLRAGGSSELARLLALLAVVAVTLEAPRFRRREPLGSKAS